MSQIPAVKSSNEQRGLAHLAVKKPSLFWLFFPILCISMALTVLFSLSDIKLDISVDWLAQYALFMQMNAALSVIPDFIWKAMAELGDATVLIPVLSLVFLGQKPIWLAMAYAAPIASVVCSTLKNVVNAPRPGAVLESGSYIQLGEFLGGMNSFPSGHTTTVFVAIVAILCVLFPKPRTLVQSTAIVGGLSIAALLGMSRIAVGAHWPLDVVLGAGIGAAAAYTGARLSIRSRNVWADNKCIQIVARSLPALLSLILIQRIFVSEELSFIVSVSTGCGLLASFLMMKDWFNRKGLLS